MSLLTLSEVRARVATSLGDADLQDVIDQEESWLARQPGVGPLSGPRTVVIPYPSRHQPLGPIRPTDEVVVTDAGVTVAVQTVGQYVYRTGAFQYGTRGLPWIGPVTLLYTPNDEDVVRRAVIALVQDVLASGPYQSESIGDYSYTRQAGLRRGVVRSLLPGSGAPYTLQLSMGPSW